MKKDKKIENNEKVKRNNEKEEKRPEPEPVKLTEDLYTNAVKVETKEEKTEVKTKNVAKEKKK